MVYVHNGVSAVVKHIEKCLHMAPEWALKNTVGGGYIIRGCYLFSKREKKPERCLLTLNRNHMHICICTYVVHKPHINKNISNTYIHTHTYIHISVAKYTYICGFFLCLFEQTYKQWPAHRQWELTNAQTVVSKYHLPIKRSGAEKVLNKPEISC